MSKKIKKKNTFQPPCFECGGRCCQYVAIEIDRPTTKTDYDNIRWYLAHNNVHVFVDHDRKWHVEFRSACESLTADNRCHIYSERPMICRSHGCGDEECEYFDSPYFLYFTTRKEFEEYIQKKGIDWRFKKIS
ncbi:MAG: YkgJ family cysteine cluster protein [Spirochaetes bacterium]|nr:YkgJ family cysteine cluster protein [Spirochaetota bacterium]